MLQKLNVVDDTCESTLVLKRKADILRITTTFSTTTTCHQSQTAHSGRAIAYTGLFVH